MQSGIYLQKRSTLLTLAGLALVGALSACGGGSGSNQTPGTPIVDPVVPPVVTTQFDRFGLDVQLFSNTPINSTGIQLGASIDSSANITIKNLDQQLPDHPAFNYNFSFPSALPGGSSVSGNLFTIAKTSIDKEINILTPSTTKNVQNVFWRGKNDPTLFGFGAVGYALKLNSKNWPTNGNATFKGKGFQYIVDSNGAAPSNTTYALYKSDVTASVDYSAKTISIAVAPNPVLVNTIGDSAVIKADQNQLDLTANYTLANLNLSGETAIQRISTTQLNSGLGLPVKEDSLTFFGNNAQELGGFVRYSGNVTLSSGVVTRDQFISFALVKQ